MKGRERKRNERKVKKSIERKGKEKIVEQKKVQKKGRRERKRKVIDTEGRIESKEGQINDGKGKEKRRKFKKKI